MAPKKRASRITGDEARVEILAAYERAKRANPRLTQAQFIMEGSPKGHFKSEEAASRYFRKIRSGERTGGNLYRESVEQTRQGQYQVRVKVAGVGDKRGRDGDWVSINLATAGARSSFDIPAIQDTLRQPANAARFVEKLQKFKKTYDLRKMQPDMRTLQVVPIRRQRKSVSLRLNIE